ncbi:MAG TPA: LuxR C-terminal-related transcriptional regulator [Actinospica sp.]|jgi:DNA-binding NarL/FixJ family response regulator|nr:LuxR C-terminal-related transcriptional regulator [Actinospica sp.]
MGMTTMLRQRSELDLLEPSDQPVAAVRVLCTDTVDEPALATMRGWNGGGGQARVVLVVGDMREAGLFEAIECGVVAVVRRRETTPASMLDAIRAAQTGAGQLPADLLGGLLVQVGRARRLHGSHDIVAASGAMTGFSDREADVIKLVAEGLDTHEIATKLSYSERTIKNVLHGLMLRLHLRNRAHAVAYAARQGYL